MATTLKAVAGADDSNTYTLRDEATAILSGRASAISWASATDAKRDAALIEATSEFEQRVTWRGEKAEATQALSFPRTGLERDGLEVAGDSIPAELVRATALYANFLLSGGESPGGVLGLGSVRGMRVQAQDALPGLVLAAIPAAWLRSFVGSTVGSVSWD